MGKKGKLVWSTDPGFKPSKKADRDKDRSGGVCKFGEPVFLESHRGKRLVKEKGKMRTQETRTKASHWQVLESEKKGFVFLRGSHGEHLQDADGGVKSSKMQLGRETWKLTKLEFRFP